MGGMYAAVGAEQARAALQAAWDEGVRAFDTAPRYGAGLSERRLGAFLAERPGAEAVVSTKVGFIPIGSDYEVGDEGGYYATPGPKLVPDFTGDGALRCVEASLERLGRDHIDVALIHDPVEHREAALDGAYPVLHELRAQGVVRAIGVGMVQADMLAWFVERADLDCVLVAGCYSLLGTPAAELLFPACEDRGVAVLAAGVYKSGILADPRPGAQLDYEPAPTSVLERVNRIRGVCERYGVPLAAAALQFVLAHPAVTAIVVGAATAREAHENAAHFRSAVPRELFDELATAGLAAPLPHGAAQA